MPQQDTPELLAPHLEDPTNVLPCADWLVKAAAGEIAKMKAADWIFIVVDGKDSGDFTVEMRDYFVIQEIGCGR